MNGYDIRRPTKADAEAIHELVAEHDTKVVGRPDATLDDVAEVLGELDLDADGWLVYESDRLVGWGWACPKGTSDNVDIDVQARVPAVADWLWDRVLERAVEIARGLGHDRARVDIGIYREDAELRAAAQERGLAPATSFHRMRIDHPGGAPAAEPEIPSGVTVESGEPDEERLRTAHRIQQEGFARHFGFVPRTFDEWVSAMEASPANDWSQLLVARVDGEPAAMLLGTDHFLSDEGCGYVRTLAVLPGFRGRGLGRLLLRTAFAADARRGRAGTILHVDSNNVTPALDLYLSVGMRRVLAIDAWQADLPTGPASEAERE
ncbi:GNAT family N-acetyltransferase [Microtetraspora niveoalba]|uniref:GNAT family N-acetyltransferase n=1 Tax=Microtetraspora niveoalba TaxID=46175 RepID=UPI00082D4842|nr:GNAT family N-acetyltransferase [Microtetraspora niveoalba]